jgi:AraC family transcriptional regulator
MSPPGPKSRIHYMNRYQPLLATTDFALRVFDHPEHDVHEDPDLEVAAGWGIAFVRRGGFSITVAGKRRDLRAGSLFITHPGLTFRCTHPDGCTDDVCVSIALNDASVAGLEDAWTNAGWAARETATPRLALVQRRLESAIASRNEFNVERFALEAVDALVADTSPLSAERTSLRHGATTSSFARGRYASRQSDLDAVVHACQSIDTDATARRSIAERAQAVGRSGTQLTRAFRRYVGLSPHQYVLRRRLIVAADLLAAGRSVSDACFHSGFENLSHFIRSFQRAYAVRPSQWPQLAPSEMRRKVQDLQRGKL